MAVNKEDLLAAGKLTEKDFDLLGVGQVRIRALSRGEAARLSDLGSTAEREMFMILHGLVEPKLTKAEVQGLYNGAVSGLLAPLLDEIATLSGQGENAVKEQMTRFPDESGD
ncbi:MAG: hypothetical protein R2761_23580 [Acidimicrobiales bacterium]